MATASRAGCTVVASGEVSRSAASPAPAASGLRLDGIDTGPLALSNLDLSLRGNVALHGVPDLEEGDEAAARAPRRLPGHGRGDG